jgi:GDPmannose 4,6-dehydratase
MWLMLQQDTARDYVLSTGRQHSVREFCELVAKWHEMDLEWIGSGTDEKGIDRNTGQIIYEINPEFYRPADVNTLLGDSTKAKIQLGWTLKHTLESLVDDMCSHDWNAQNGK